MSFVTNFIWYIRAKIGKIG